MSEAQRPLILIPYVLVWILATWWLHRMADRNEGMKEGDSFVAALIGFFWPIGVALVVAASPFLLIGWIASRLPRSRR